MNTPVLDARIKTLDKERKQLLKTPVQMRWTTLKKIQELIDRLKSWRQEIKANHIIQKYLPTQEEVKESQTDTFQSVTDPESVDWVGSAKII